MDCPPFEMPPMRVALSVLLLASALSACTPAPVSTASSAEAPAPASAIAWRQGDVDDAFAEAADSGKPVLLYWGAVWCPPCNQLKAGLFKDPAELQAVLRHAAEQSTRVTMRYLQAQ